jgi:hypothetical protein
MNLPDTFSRLINGKYPDFYEVESLLSVDVLSQQHFFGFFLYRGQIISVTPLIMKNQGIGEVDLPDRYEYHAELTDELGSITLHSPVFSDERKMHQEISDAFNKESIVELLVFVTPFPDIDSSGSVKNTAKKIVTLWPVNLREVSTLQEDAQFTHTNFGYDITFRRKTVSYPDDSGFHYLYKLLSMPNEEFSSQELYIAREGFYVPEYDVAQIRDYIFNETKKDEEIASFFKKIPKKRRAPILEFNRELLNLKEVNDSLNPDVDSVKINDNILHIRFLKEAIFRELDIKDAKGNTATSIIKVTANYVAKAIQRAFDKIEKQQPALQVLLAKRITKGAECKYTDDLDHPIQWLT